MTENDIAVKELKALLEIPGALRVITSEHRCGGEDRIAKPGKIGTGYIPKTEEEREQCDAFEFDLKDPRHFVIHDVVSLEGPDHKGLYRARTAEGDWCEGQPDALLKRLREARAE